MSSIEYFKERFKYGFLSPYFAAPFTIDGVEWPTSEHYVQAMKFQGTPYEDVIRTAPNPYRAKALGTKHMIKLETDVKLNDDLYYVRDGWYGIRNDWDDVKIKVLKKSIKEKFKQNPKLKEQLLATDDAPLVFDNPHDNYLGVGARKNGTNVHGRLLMGYRDSIRERSEGGADRKDAAQKNSSDSGNIARPLSGARGLNSQARDARHEVDEEGASEAQSEQTLKGSGKAPKDGASAAGRDGNSDDEYEPVSVEDMSDQTELHKKKKVKMNVREMDEEKPFYYFTKDNFLIVRGYELATHVRQLIKLGGKPAYENVSSASASASGSSRSGGGASAPQKRVIQVKFELYLKDDVKKYIFGTFDKDYRDLIVRRRWIKKKVKFYLDQIYMTKHLTISKEIVRDDVEAVITELNNCPLEKECKRKNKNLIIDVIYEKLDDEYVISEDAAVYMACSIFTLYKQISKRSKREKKTFEEIVEDIDTKVTKKIHKFSKVALLRPTVAISIVRSIVHIATFLATQTNSEMIDDKIMRQSCILFFPNKLRQTVRLHINDVMKEFEKKGLDETIKAFDIKLNMKDVKDIIFTLHDDALMILIASAALVLYHIQKHTAYAKVLIRRSYYYSRHVMYVISVEKQLKGFDMDAFVFLADRSKKSFVQSLLPLPDSAYDEVKTGTHKIVKKDGVQYVMLNPASTSREDTFHSLALALSELINVDAKAAAVDNIVFPYKLGDDFMNAREWNNIVEDINRVSSMSDVRNIIFYIVKDPEQHALRSIIKSSAKSVPVGSAPTTTSSKPASKPAKMTTDPFDEEDGEGDDDVMNTEEEVEKYAARMGFISPENMPPPEQGDAPIVGAAEEDGDYVKVPEVDGEKDGDKVPIEVGEKDEEDAPVEGDPDAVQETVEEAAQEPVVEEVAQDPAVEEVNEEAKEEGAEAKEEDAKEVAEEVAQADEVIEAAIKEREEEIEESKEEAEETAEAAEEAENEDPDEEDAPPSPPPSHPTKKASPHPSPPSKKASPPPTKKKSAPSPPSKKVDSEKAEKLPRAEAFLARGKKAAATRRANKEAREAREAAGEAAEEKVVKPVKAKAQAKGPNAQAAKARPKDVEEEPSHVEEEPGHVDDEADEADNDAGVEMTVAEFKKGMFHANSPVSKDKNISNPLWRQMFSNEWTTDQVMDGKTFASNLHAVGYFTTLAFEEEHSLDDSISKKFLEKSDGSLLTGARARTLLQLQTKKFNQKSWQSFCTEWFYGKGGSSGGKKKGDITKSKGWALMKRCLKVKFKDPKFKQLLKETKDANIHLISSGKIIPKFATSTGLFQYMWSQVTAPMDQMMKADDFGTLKYQKLSGKIQNHDEVYALGHNMVGRILMEMRDATA